MRRQILAGAVLLVAACTVLTACGSSGGSGTGSTGGTAGSKTITIGVVTDLTGAASSGFTTDVKGIQAYANRINAAGGVNGYTIKYANGLLAPEKISFHDYAPATGCMWVALLMGESFSVVPGMPICAPNVKVAG